MQLARSFMISFWQPVIGITSGYYAWPQKSQEGLNKLLWNDPFAFQAILDLKE